MVFSFYDPVRKDWFDNRMHEVYINVKQDCINKAQKAVEETQKIMSEKRLTINDFINWDIEETSNGRNTLCFRINYNSKNEHSIYRLLTKYVKDKWRLRWCKVTQFGDEFNFKDYKHIYIHLISQMIVDTLTVLYYVDNTIREKDDKNI